MAETMAPQRVKRIMQYTPEQFCKVNKEQNIRRMYLREIQEHIDATDETLTEISKNPLPEELIKRWSNDTKRREYIADYKNTADEVLEQSELELTFYITTLPNGNKIVAMEYWSTNYSYLTKEYGEKSIRTKYYYQDKEWFEPSSASESFISEKLKELKMQLQNRE